MAGAPAGAPPPPPHRPRAPRAAGRRGAGAARRGRGARGRPRPARPGRRGGRRLLPLFLYRPGPRGARARHRAGGMAGGLRHDLGPRRAAVPRVRALHDHRDERLHRPQGAPLRAPLRRPAEGRGRRRRPPHHGIERRRGDGGDGGGAAGDHPHVGPRRRRARRRLGGAAFRQDAPDHLRCRRHQRRYRHRDRRPLQRGDGAGHLDRRLPGAGADDRHHDDRRGRRQHRQGRCRRRLQGRARECGLEAGPGLLWPGRRGADGDRCEPRARPARRGQFPRRRDGPRARAGRRGRSPRSPRRSTSTRWKPPRAC